MNTATISAPPADADFECDTPDTFCKAMKIGKTAFYEDVAKGLITVIHRSPRKTIIPPGERRAYLERLAALEASKSAA